mmetsp:Transcript_36736/g.65768  ORF Transcript_36736/g.65768 Transcript_36736/m.65768 type:complete len:286 (+) Transcript_36736:167-1024(+)
MRLHVSAKLLHLDALLCHVVHDGVHPLAHLQNLLVPVLQLLRRHIEPNHPLHLVDAPPHSLLRDHPRRHRLCPLRRHPQQGSQLRTSDVVVELTGCGQIVLRHRAVQHRGAVRQLRALVRPQRLRERLHLRGPQYPLEVHLFQKREQRQARAALVLVQGGQHPRALRPGGGQDGARDRRRQRLLQLPLVHHLSGHLQRLQLAELVVSGGRLQKLALGIQNAGVTDLVLQLERFILATRHQKVGLLDEDLRIDWVVVLKVEHRNFDVFGELVRRVRAAHAAVEVDA